MNKHRKKLQLKKEHVRALSNQELENAAGALPALTFFPCDTSNCLTLGEFCVPSNNCLTLGPFCITG